MQHQVAIGLTEMKFAQTAEAWRLVDKLVGEHSQQAEALVGYQYV